MAFLDTSLMMEGNVIVTSASDINYILKARVHMHCISRSPCDANQNYRHECFSSSASVCRCEVVMTMASLQPCCHMGVVQLLAVMQLSYSEQHV